MRQADVDDGGWQDVVVTIPDVVKVQVVAPGSKDLKSATAGTVSDVSVGDKVLVMGDAGAGGAGIRQRA